MKTALLSNAAICLILSGAALQASACKPAYIALTYEAKAQKLVYSAKMQQGDLGFKSFGEDIVLEGVDIKNFRLILPDTRKSKSKEKNKWSDGDAFSGDQQYFSDGKNIYYKGKKITNPKGQPEVDIATFQRPVSGESSFAADQYSLYFDGIRTDENTGNKKVDLKTLSYADGALLKDANNLYFRGKYAGTAKGFAILKTAQEKMGGSCHNGDEVISRSADSVFLNGEKISSDAPSFNIIEWTAGVSLKYSDKTGRHTYTYRAR